jgi:hypothetical protein
MKSFIQAASIFLLFLCGLSTNIDAAQAQQQMPSVHEMFQNFSQDELLSMMEEGQRFIQNLEKNGTPEQKMAFAQAMEETLQSFTPEDWAEFEAIVETVQDKLPPMDIEQTTDEATKPEEKPTPTEEVKTQPIKVVIDNSLEKMITDINKAINAILIKAKSDKLLSERIALHWDNKDNFNEMARLIQVLKSKEHLERLGSDKEEIKILVELLRNFNKRLQIENNDFIIADTFGLEVDEQISAENLKKLNKIIKFFDSAIESLLPKIIKFLQEFEPQALKIAQEHDKQAKQSLDHATQVEKQKRSAQPAHSGRSGNQKHTPHVSYAQGGYRPAAGMHTTEQVPGYLETIHQQNLQNIPTKKASSKDGKANEPSHKDKNNDVKPSAYASAINNIDDYLTINNNAEVGKYMSTVGNATNIYAAFGSPISADDINLAEQLEHNKATSSITPEHEKFLQRHQERVQKAHKNFVQNTQQAHTYYAQLKDSIDTVAIQVDEMQMIISSIKSNLESMTASELEKLQHAPSLQSLAGRIQSYHDQLKKVQHELRNKHKLHRLQRENPYEISAYNDLAKAESLHGLDSKINTLKAHFDALQKVIKSSISRRRRDENKKAAQQ